MPPPRNFKFHDNILSFAEHDIVLCFVSRVDTVDNPKSVFRVFCDKREIDI